MSGVHLPSNEAREVDVFPAGHEEADIASHRKTHGDDWGMVYGMVKSHLFLGFDHGI